MPGLGRRRRREPTTRRAGRRPHPLDRPWVHPSELQVVRRRRPAAPPSRPAHASGSIGLVSAGAARASSRCSCWSRSARSAVGSARRSRRRSSPRPTPRSTTRWRERVASARRPERRDRRQRPAGADGKRGRARASCSSTDRVVTSAHLRDRRDARSTVTTNDGDTLTAKVIGRRSRRPTSRLLLGRRRRPRSCRQLELVTTPRDRRPGRRGRRRRRATLGWTSIGVVPEQQLARVVRRRRRAVAGTGRHEHRHRPRDVRRRARSTRTARSSGSSSTPPGGARQGLAVPIDVAVDVADQLERAANRSTHGWLGVLFGDDAAGTGRRRDGRRGRARRPGGEGRHRSSRRRHRARRRPTRCAGWHDAIAVARAPPADRARSSSSSCRGSRTIQRPTPARAAADAVDTLYGPSG